MEPISSPHIFQNKESKRHTLCQDSGFNEALQTSNLEASEFDNDTPKENISQHWALTLSSDTPRKNQVKASVISTERGVNENASFISWCETPKISKRETSLRRRLLMSKAVTDGRTSSMRTPENRHFISSRIPRPEEVYSNGITDSPDMGLFGALATSTLKAEELTLSCRKRRLMFSLVKTSTLEDGNHNITQPPVFVDHADELLIGEGDLGESSIFSLPTLLTPRTPSDGECLILTDERFQTPINELATNLGDSLNVLSTPFFTPISKLDTSASEDSGFTSLNKSQDLSVDHDGSFQELLQQSAFRGKETPKLAELRKRTRLERQRRLPTLREGGSQSEEELRVVESVPGKVMPKLKGEQEVLTTEEDDELFLEKTPLGTTPVNLEDLYLTPALQMVHVLCQRSARSLKAQPSLEELLRSPGDSPSLRTMPLVGLIGRKMGLEKLDILMELKVRNLRHILGKILKFLSCEDIYRIGQVSHVWDEIISQDKMAHRQRAAYMKEFKVALERGGSVCVPDAETRLNCQSRSALKSVQAQSKLSAHTPVSGSGFKIHMKQTNSSNKWDKFIEVAKTLFHDECLRPCPRCQRPAKCHSVRREGLCSQEDCAYQFCTGCLCAYHGSKECASGSAKRCSKKEVLPGSAQSKRNIRRL